MQSSSQRDAPPQSLQREKPKPRGACQAGSREKVFWKETIKTKFYPWWNQGCSGFLGMALQAGTPLATNGGFMDTNPGARAARGHPEPAGKGDTSVTATRLCSPVWSCRRRSAKGQTLRERKGLFRAPCPAPPLPGVSRVPKGRAI